jgi:hypothetical protein
MVAQSMGWLEARRGLPRWYGITAAALVDELAAVAVREGPFEGG